MPIKVIPTPKTPKHRNSDPSSSEEYGQQDASKEMHRKKLYIAFLDAASKGGQHLTAREAMDRAGLDLDTSAWTRVSELHAEGLIKRIEDHKTGEPIKRPCQITGRTVTQYRIA